MRTPILVSIMALPLCALAACTVGPNYKDAATAGAVAPPAQFARAADPAVAATQALDVASWWKAMGDPALDQLEEQALAANPSVAVAEARLRQARATVRSKRADAAPSASASALAIHANVPGFDLGSSSSDSSTSDSSSDSQSLNLYNLGFDASWEVDLWGGKRRGVEAARAQLDAAQANVADAQVTLTAEVAQAYVNLRERQQRIALVEQDAAAQRQTLELTRQRRAAGTASELDLEQQRDKLEQSEAARLPLVAERDAYLNALAVLTGQAPGALDAVLGSPAAVPLPPASVPVSDPASLIRRRPDVRAAERQYAAATAQIGVAEAARFPSLSFMGLIGIGGTHVDDVVDPGNLATIALPRLSWNFLDFGRTASQVEKAKGAQDEAAAQYRGAVLNALQDSEDALARYGAGRLTVASAERTLATADRTTALMRQRFAAGTGSRIQLLDAQRQSLSAAQALSQANGAMTADFVALQKALGLGWRE